MNEAVTKTAEEKFCHECGGAIKAKAEICPKCGVRQTTPGSSFGAVAPNGKSRVAASLFAFFLGGIGGQKFYLGKTGQGILFILFCWTFIPSLIGFIEGIIFLTMSDDAFIQKYGTA